MASVPQRGERRYTGCKKRPGDFEGIAGLDLRVVPHPDAE